MNIKRRTVLGAAIAALFFTPPPTTARIHGGLPTGGGGGGVGLPFNVTLYNVDQSNAAVQPVVSWFQPFPDGAVPGTGSISGMDSLGGDVVVQMDAKVTWPSGYLSGAVCSVKMSETVPAGGSKVYTFTPNTSASPTNLNAGWGGSVTYANVHDIRCQFSGGDCGTDTYTVKLRDIMQNKSAWPWGNNRPTGGWKIVKSGPVCVEVHAWQFIQNDNTGKYQGYVRHDMYVKMWGAPGGNAEVDAETTMRNMWNTITLSSTTSEKYGLVPNRFVANLVISNGTTPVGYMGGPNDPRAVTASSASVFNVAAQTATISGLMGQTPYIISSTGALPTGISGTTPYYPAGNKLYKSREYVSHIEQGISIDDWAAGTPYGLFTYKKSGAYYYFSFYGGTSGSIAPTGDTFTESTGLTWDRLGPVFSDVGTGNVTFSPIYQAYSNNGWRAGDVNGDPIWVGSGVRHQVFPHIDFTYLVNSKAVPSYKAGLATVKTDHAVPQFQPCRLPECSGGLWNIDTPGDGNGDPRIGYLDPWSVASFYLPDDPYYIRMAIQCALTWSGWIQQFLYDEQSGLPFVANNGPADDGVAYPNYPAVRPSFVWNNAVANRSSPTTPGDYRVYESDAPVGMNGIGQAFFVQASHLPMPGQGAYIKTGRAIFAEHLISQGAASAWANQNSFVSYNGKTTYTPIMNAGSIELRACGWQRRNLVQGMYFCPDNHPFKPVIKDYYNSHFDYHGWLRTQQPSNAAAFGILPRFDHGLGTQYGAGVVAPWMWDHEDFPICMEQWRGGLTSASKPNIQTCFDYGANRYNIYSTTDNSDCLIGTYDLQYGPTPMDNSSTYSTRTALLNAGYGASGTFNPPSSFPPLVTNKVNDPIAGNAGNSYAYVDPNSISGTPSMALNHMAQRLVANLGNTHLSDLYTSYLTKMSNGTGVPTTQLAQNFTQIVNGHRENYMVWCCGVN